MKILFADDEVNLREVITRELARMGHRVDGVSTGEEALAAIEKESYDAVILDIKMPGMGGMETLHRIKEANSFAEVVMLTGHGTIESAIDAMKIGAFDYLTKPCRLAEMIAVLHRIEERQKMRKENMAYERSMRQAYPQEEMVTADPKILDILKLVQDVGSTPSTVLIEGESGTGKELIARALHRHSTRASLPLLAINCASVAENLLSSELFGHEKGAFTGATERRAGLFEVAHQGTLFLDEVGEMSGPLQAALLRVLENGEFMRVGGTRQIKVDVRILCATNKNLQEEIKQGRFRQDLFYRLNVVHIQIPPLRDRRKDIPLLVDHFLASFKSAGRRVPNVPAPIMSLLCAYDWPGNIRELENLIERLVLLRREGEVTVQDIPAMVWDRVDQGATRPSGSAATSQGASLMEVEKQHIIETMMLNKWNKSKAAQILGISLQTLYNKLKEYSITPP